MKRVSIQINGGERHVGKGNTMRAALKDGAERATRDLGKMKVGDTATFTRIQDTVL